VRTSSPTSGSLGGSAGLTCQVGRSARCIAGVQSHEDERDQGQHRHSHCGREREQALCADHRSLHWNGRQRGQSCELRGQKAS
jgi:hypothetical protein